MKHSEKIISFILAFCLLNTSGISQDTLPVRDSLTDSVTGKIKIVTRKSIIKGSPGEVFTFMDDIGNTGMHMTKKNAPMMGSKLTIEWLTEHKTGPGAKYRWRGKVMGMKMDFTVEVTKWIHGEEKVWETTGDAKMIVLEWYRMYLIITPQADGTAQAELGIYYTKSKGSFLGFLLAKRYSVWCVKSMLKDTRNHFLTIHNELTNK